MITISINKINSCPRTKKKEKMSNGRMMRKSMKMKFKSRKKEKHNKVSHLYLKRKRKSRKK